MIKLLLIAIGSIFAINYVSEKVKEDKDEDGLDLMKRNDREYQKLKEQRASSKSKDDSFQDEEEKLANRKRRTQKDDSKLKDK